MQWDSSRENRERDRKEIESRVHHRGLGFLTGDLPSLGNALLRALETGRFTRPPAFSGWKRSSSIPAFMQGHFKRLFDDDGVLLQDFDPHLVQEIVQICFLAYKVDLPISKAKHRRVIDSFVATDLELPPCESVYITDPVIRGARRLLAELFEGFDPKDIQPKHGPGAVATGERANEKFSFSRLYNNIHQFYPYYDYFVVGGGREIIDRVSWYKSLERLPHGVAKVILVPKDARGPRLISEEPLEYQWIQQGLGKAISRHVENHPLTRGFVNFTDQDINQELARSASITGDLATLDLKDASDRVSCALVRTLFPPGITDAILSCRSGWTALPDGRVLELKKHAPMGSALCFPVMALVLWSLTQSIINETRTVARVEHHCYVYGDDLVVPTDIAQLVLAYLPGVHLRANESKSFYQGFFRESCGGDFYKGVRVTPLRAKTPWTANREDSKAYVSYVYLVNALYERGFWNASRWLRCQVEDLFGRIPHGTTNAPYPCILVDDPLDALCLNMGMSSRDRRWTKTFLISKELRSSEDHPQSSRSSMIDLLDSISTFDGRTSRPFRFRWNDSLQRAEFKLRTIGSPKFRSEISGWQRLLKFVSGDGDGERSVRLAHLKDDGLFGMFSHDPDAVFDSVVPRSTLMKREWLPVA